MSDYQHELHPHTAAVIAGEVTPPKVEEQRGTGINGRIGKFITVIVGTMWAAYLFTLLALISLPSAIHTGDKIIIVAWIAQTFLQLVLLPIIIVGQNILGKAADARADLTYKDAEAILTECLALQAHLQAQDTVLEGLIAKQRKK